MGNVAAGSERIGFKIPGAPCKDSTARGIIPEEPDAIVDDGLDGSFISSRDRVFALSVAHSTMQGLAWRGECKTSCMEFTDAVVYSNWQYGVFANAQCSIRLNRVRVIDNKIGILLAPVNEGAFSHTSKSERHWLIQSSFISNKALSGSCSSPQPNSTDKWASPATTAHVGLMISGFPGRLTSSIPNDESWMKVHDFAPGLYGSGYLDNVVFSEWTTDECGREHHMVSTNKYVADAIHPTYFKEIQYVGVQAPNKFYIHPPNAGWVDPSVCASMDCDGPKHTFFYDLDGTLLWGESGASVVSRAEYSSSNAYGYKAPDKLLRTEHPVRRALRAESEVIDQYGIVRPNCTLQNDWNAWSCQGHQTHHYRMMIIESMDSDHAERSLVPVALTSGGTTDIMNGGQHHMFSDGTGGEAVASRLSTFWSVVQTGYQYDLTFASSNPSSLRFHLMEPTNAYGAPISARSLSGSEHCTVLKMFYPNNPRLQVYKTDEHGTDSFVIDMNWEGNKHKCRLNEPANCDTYANEYPSVSSTIGSNTFDSATSTLWYFFRSASDAF